MVSKTLKLEQVFSWHHVFDVVSEDVVFVYHYPDENTILKIKLDKASIDILKQKRNQIAQLMEQEITLTGIVQEKHEKQSRTKTEEIEEWVRVA